jgi:hypothetical protein
MLDGKPGLESRAFAANPALLGSILPDVNVVMALHKREIRVEVDALGSHDGGHSASGIGTCKY